MWIAGLEVAIGLSFVVFVHELGHFVVAKLCGVKVEKFFIGFDIAGLKLLSWRRGETLYGIGILPLGGYVKMLGQEDNPAQLRKEMERARHEEGGETVDSAAAATPAAVSDPSDAKPRFDPRSFLAKSVPQRMAIISAGVIMNLIFALVFAVLAFGVGVKQNPTIVGGVMAGGAAWQAGIEANDEILEVAGQKVHTFRHMTEEIITADLTHGVALLVRRPGVEKPLEIVVKPEELGGAPKIGVFSSLELKLEDEKNTLPYLLGSAAAEAKEPFLPGDRIVQIDGQPIVNFGQLQDYLVAHAAADLTVAVVRSKAAGGKAAKPDDTENVQISVPKCPMKHFGLVMTMGSIAAVQVHSAAAEAGIQAGDVLKTIDGKPVADPMRLPGEFHKRAGTEVALGLERGGKPLAVKVKASVPRYAPSAIADCPVAISELGLAYYVLNTVVQVEPGSPAAAAGLQAGDRITTATVKPPSKEQLAELRKKYPDEDLRPDELTLHFSNNERNWPAFLLSVQNGLPGTSVEFGWRRGEKEMTGKAVPAEAKDWFNSQRGWILQPRMFVQTANGFSEAVRWGARESVDATLLVYRTLHSVGTQQISIRNFSGPWGIISAALMQARKGFGNLLVFLTLLSANLAVVNFLPIPLLDGGHLVLLIYEGIRGKPADERVLEVLTWIGLALHPEPDDFRLRARFGLDRPAGGALTIGESITVA